MTALENDFVRAPKLRTDRPKAVGEPLTAKDKYDLNFYKKELLALEKFPPKSKKDKKRVQDRILELQADIIKLEARNTPTAPLARKEVHLEETWNKPPQKAAIFGKKGQVIRERNIKSLGSLKDIQDDLRYRQPVEDKGFSRSFQLQEKEKELMAAVRTPITGRDQTQVVQLRDDIAKMEDERDSANNRYDYGNEMNDAALAQKREDIHQQMGTPKKSFWGKVKDWFKQ